MAVIVSADDDANIRQVIIRVLELSSLHPSEQGSAARFAVLTSG
jgi:hypothetical protein